MFDEIQVNSHTHKNHISSPSLSHHVTLESFENNLSQDGRGRDQMRKQHEIRSRGRDSEPKR